MRKPRPEVTCSRSARLTSISQLSDSRACAPASALPLLPKLVWKVAQSLPVWGLVGTEEEGLSYRSKIKSKTIAINYLMQVVWAGEGE